MKLACHSNRSMLKLVLIDAISCMIMYEQKFVSTKTHKQAKSDSNQTAGAKMETKGHIGKHIWALMEQFRDYSRMSSNNPKTYHVINIKTHNFIQMLHTVKYSSI